MSQSNNGIGSKVGEVISPPPNSSMPPQTGYTPFWEAREGLLYAPNSEAPQVDLSVGAWIHYDQRVEIGSGGNFNVAYNISNF